MPAQSEAYEVRNRWTNAVQFTASIECAPDTSIRVKLGLAVRWARRNDADLRGADLRDADLRGAVLRDADLRGADLRGADLRGAVLRAFKADMWMTLSQNRAEVPGLIAAMRDGRIDGSQYSGDCACLVGTIANIAGVSYGTLDPNSGNPAERWFMMIRKGDKPGDDTGGGFAAGKALEWALEYAALTGIDPDGAPVAQAEAA